MWSNPNTSPSKEIEKMIPRQVTVEIPEEVIGLSEEEIGQLFLIGLREMRIEKALIRRDRGQTSDPLLNLSE